MSSNPLISIVIPARNASARLGKCLDSIRQAVNPGEIEVIIADGLSEDATKQIAVASGAIVLDNRGKGSAPGRNMGVAVARGDFIAFTDADCTVDKFWNSNAIKYFKDGSVAGISGPVRTPEEQNAFAQAVGLIFHLAVFLAHSCHKEEGCLHEAHCIPTCNAIYRRQALSTLYLLEGPFDASLANGSDAELNYRLTRLGYKFVFAPDVAVRHYRRDTPAQFWKQMYGYGAGRLRIGRKWPKLLNTVHVGTALTLPLTAIVLALWPVYPAMADVFFGLGASMMGLAGLWAFFRTRSLKIALCMSIALAVLAYGWSAGFIRELFRRRESIH